jgi:hypothetical protein
MVPKYFRISSGFDLFEEHILNFSGIYIYIYLKQSHKIAKIVSYLSDLDTK